MKNKKPQRTLKVWITGQSHTMHAEGGGDLAVTLREVSIGPFTFENMDSGDWRAMAHNDFDRYLDYAIKVPR